MGEAFVGLGDEAKGQEQLEKAYAAAPEGWMADSTREQMAKLKLLLDKSPMKFVRADAG
jgi:hypothetical protein